MKVRRRIRLGRPESPKIAKIRADAAFARGVVTAENLAEWPWLRAAIRDWAYDGYSRVWRRFTPEERSLAESLAVGRGAGGGMWEGFVSLAQRVLEYQGTPRASGGNIAA